MKNLNYDYKNITDVKVFGYVDSIVASGYPMQTVAKEIRDYNDSDFERAFKLGNAKQGSGHDNFLNGIVVQFNWTIPVKMWTEVERYHFIDFVSSQSTMHKLKDMNLDISYDEHVDPRIIEIMKEKQAAYRENPTPTSRLELLMSNPCGMNLTARMTTNYRQLKTVYRQRKDHALPQWRDFCEWIENLPYAKELGICGDSFKITHYPE